MRRLFRSLLSALALGAAALSPGAAAAGVTVAIDLSTQSMTVSEDGAVLHRWAISSGRDGYRTPNGTYRPQRLVRMHYSRKYDMSPMPHSIFFRGGYAIHGTGETRRLGRSASHGCIRLAPGNAATLFSLVTARGAGATRIVVTGSAAIADARTAPIVRRARAEPRWAAEEPPPRRLRARADAPYRVIHAPRRFYDPYGGYYYAPVYGDPYGY